jgi:hypothetical protein
MGLRSVEHMNRRNQPFPVSTEGGFALGESLFLMHLHSTKTQNISIIITNSLLLLKVVLRFFPFQVLNYASKNHIIIRHLNLVTLLQIPFNP